MRLAVLISGTGTNLEAILTAIAAGQLDASVGLVISSRPDAAGLQKAAAAKVPTISLSRVVYNEPWAADELIAQKITEAGCDFVALAGYMRKVHPALINAFPDRIVNLHPALLPAFPGADAIAQAWHYGVRITGVTVHFVDAAYDSGPIIAQRALSINPDDTLETLTQRIHAIEHQIYPQTLQLLASGRVSIIDGRVTIR